MTLQVSHGRQRDSPTTDTVFKPEGRVGTCVDRDQEAYIWTPDGDVLDCIYGWRMLSLLVQVLSRRGFV